MSTLFITAVTWKSDIGVFEISITSLKLYSFYKDVVIFFLLFFSVLIQVLRFVGLLCGFNCAYMPLLIVDPRSVLADLPITLPSLLSDPNWSSVRSSVAENLWSSMNRVRTWVEHSFDGHGLVDDVVIKETDSEMGFLLARAMHETCVVLREHLPFNKQLKVANSDF